jgi:hypothetical protein
MHWGRGNQVEISNLMIIPDNFLRLGSQVKRIWNQIYEQEGGLKMSLIQSMKGSPSSLEVSRGQGETPNDSRELAKEK